MEDKNRVLTHLFREGEGLCLGNSLKTINVISLEEALEMPPVERYCVNPLSLTEDRGAHLHWHNPAVPRRADVNVTSFKNFVLEFDKNTMEEQLEILRTRDVPYSVLTFSGSKSCHAIISLSTPLETQEEYRQIFNIIRKVLWTTDGSCVNPSRLTRLAGCVRADTGKEQQLLDLRRSISIYELKRWLSRFQKHIDKLTEEENKKEAIRREQLEQIRREGLKGLEVLSEEERSFLDGAWNGQGSRHSRLVALAYKLRDAGLSQEELEAVLTEAHLALGIERDIQEAVDIANYVFR